MVSYDIIFSRQAQKDARKLTKSNLKTKASELIEIIKKDPFQSPPRIGVLTGNLEGCYSRRINIQHRLVYEVLEEQNIVHVLRMWSHYGE
ncbi:Txe/YoeB family addiction module toxin [Pelagicoccus sp. SDUM812002]|uniref:Txe/YoeB family addiction module toxin n=1 Tax=Pelagicoccus sp. SDUM812002 TaxID=3041266 RepID=UPI0031F303B8